MSDPTCRVEAFGSIENTQIYKNTTACVFDRWFLFKKKNVKDLDQEKIVIKVFDANSILRNELIGSCLWLRSLGQPIWD
jgi:hypothetical protein